jgi:hypothetical protein
MIPGVLLEVFCCGHILEISGVRLDTMISPQIHKVAIENTQLEVVGPRLPLENQQNIIKFRRQKIDVASHESWYVYI